MLVDALRLATYSAAMPLPRGFVPPCLPTKAPQPPSGEAWVHEIKHDGFRVIARKVRYRTPSPSVFPDRSFSAISAQKPITGIIAPGAATPLPPHLAA